MLLRFVAIISCIFIAKIACDTCDTYVHPQYGKGSCIDTGLCPYSLYISGLCESKPTNVRCCFSYTGSPSGSVACSSATQKLSHSTAFSHISSNGISIYSSGGCSDRNNGKCTSLDQINCAGICALVNLKKQSGCSITVTGGTEVGHSAGTYSHYNGYKIDIGINSCIDGFIKKYKYIGIRADESPQYQDTKGNIYALEGNHWDNTYYAC